VRVITSLYEEEWRDEQEIVVEDAVGLAMAVSVMITLNREGALIYLFRRLS